MHRATIGAVILPTVVAACAGPAAAEARFQGAVSVDTIGGVIHVANRGPGAWRAEEAWAIEDVWRIGSIDDDGPGMLGDPTGVAFGHNGQILVVDFQTHDLKVFDGDGMYVRTLGGAGRGPGELSGPVSVAPSPGGHIWVADQGNRRYTVFDSTGSLVRTLPSPVVPWTLRQRLAFMEDGTIIDESGHVFEDGRRGIALARVDTAGTLIGLHPLARHPESELHDRMLGLPPPQFGGPDLGLSRPRLKHAVARDGSVWMIRTDEMRLVRSTIEGDTLLIVESDHRADAALTGAELREIRQILRNHGVDPSRLDIRREIVRGIHVLDDGHVLLQVEEAERGAGSRELDVFSPEGVFLGTMQLGFGVAVSVGPPDAAFAGDTFVALTKGDLDVPVLVRATIRRGGDG